MLNNTSLTRLSPNVTQLALPSCLPAELSRHAVIYPRISISMTTDRNKLLTNALCPRYVSLSSLMSRHLASASNRSICEYFIRSSIRLSHAATYEWVGLICLLREAIDLGQSPRNAMETVHAYQTPDCGILANASAKRTLHGRCFSF